MKRSQNYSFSIFNIIRKSTILQKENLTSRNITKKLQNKENDFNSTEKKCFSKKLTLIRLLNNNNYMLIKKNVKLGELQIPKKLYI